VPVCYNGTCHVFASRPSFRLRVLGADIPTAPGLRRCPMDRRWRLPALRWHARCAALADHAYFHRLRGSSSLVDARVWHVWVALETSERGCWGRTLTLMVNALLGPPLSLSNGDPVFLQKRKLRARCQWGSLDAPPLFLRHRIRWFSGPPSADTGVALRVAGVRVGRSCRDFAR
jgi:hypothetical protein